MFAFIILTDLGYAVRLSSEIALKTLAVVTVLNNHKVGLIYPFEKQFLRILYDFFFLKEALSACYCTFFSKLATLKGEILFC